MNITQRDVMLLFTMSLAVVSISFVFPALGISDTSTSQSQIPELNVSTDTFQLAGDMPDFPNSPKSGRLELNTTIPAEFSNNVIWLTGDTSGGVELALVPDVNNSSNAKLFLNRWNGSLAERDYAILNKSNPRAILRVQGWDVAVSLGDDHNPPGYLEVEWRVDTGSESDGFIGEIFGAANEIASVVAWFVVVFIWFSTTLVEFLLNGSLVIVDVSVYFISLLVWLTTTYGSVVASAPSWTSVFVALPGIILSVTLGKIVVIFIKLLPTT